MSDYTPTMDEIKHAALTYTAIASEADWDRALAAHDAEVRAAALAEQGTEEWEYGVTSKWGIHEHPSLAGAERYAEDLRREIQDGRSSGDLTHHGHVMKRAKAKAGPWVPVDQPAPTPGVETRTPNRPEGPKWAEVHPDAYPDYATDRPNGSES
ncbi:MULTISPECIES: hypothetical protein [unclassified Microbacterium]|uniref:hypothetical protein n=1 Tax=unclassified Microbacterium TaxID=2609290 RepID=UPI00300FBF77